MSGEDLQIVRQDHQFFLDGFHQCVIIAAGQVGASDRPLEQGVAGEQRVVIFEPQADASGGVPRRFDDGEIFLCEVSGDGWQVFGRRQERQQMVFRTVIQRFVRGIQADPGNVEFFGDRADRADMVDVCVGQEDDRFLISEIGGGMDNVGGIVAGVRETESPSIFGSTE